MTGAIRAFLNLSYNIYLIAHHTPEPDHAIAGRYVGRLKSARPSDFTGTLFETYAAAAFLKAGFTLEFEDEQDSSTSHVEFVATFPKTGKEFCVEVKSRDRSGPTADYSTDVDDIKRLRVASKLNKALGKEADHARVVLIEVNVPDVVTSTEGWPAAALKQIRDNERTDFSSGEKKPSAYVIVTNHAFHNNLDAADTGVQCLATGFHIDDFGPDVAYRGYKAVLEARDRHPEMFALLASMRTHYEIPSTFDGQMPQLEFPKLADSPQLIFGRSYLIPMPDGGLMPGRLYDAVVMEENKQIFGAYQLENGAYVNAVCPISDAELAAYKKYPETFFGEIRQPSRRLKSYVEHCDFFYEAHRATPKEKLLEFMAEAPDIEHVRGLSQEDLAVTYAERLGSRAFSEMTKRPD
jgi:hypothetical protein